MECQVDSCREFAPAWGLGIDFDDLVIVVYLCARHEREVRGYGLSLAHSTSPPPASLLRRPEPGRG